MALHYRTQGIILKKRDVGEADRVFVVFTKDFGKLTLRAVSERKITSKLRGGLELFNLSELEFIQGKTHKTITDAAPVNVYPVMRKSLERVRAMARFAEVADELLRGQERDDNIWKLFRETLVVLDKPVLREREINVLAYYFLWKLLSFAGYSPSLAHVAAKDESIARFINALLQSNSETLGSMRLEGINEDRLREISQEHLLKVLQN